MKLLRIQLILIASIVIFSATPILIHSQTAGTLSFSSNTTAPSGDWGNKHTLAIWIENAASPSDFIKTRAKYGNDDDHLTEWVAKSGKNTVDAVTGPTLTSYTTRTAIWDGTDVSSVVVPDGEYKVFIEMGWGKNKSEDHSVFSFSFNKGPDAVQLTPDGNTHYSNVSINWEPVSTLVEFNDNPDNISVYPNPSSGMLNLKINESLPSARLMIKGVSGAILSVKEIENGFSGDYNIDLSSYQNGLYMIILDTHQKKYIYKTILQK